MTFAAGVFHLGTGVDNDSLTKSVLGLGVGASEGAVSRRLGAPFDYAAGARETCWDYHAERGSGPTSESGSSPFDAIDFCMRRHRVARIVLGSDGVHG